MYDANIRWDCWESLTNRSHTYIYDGTIVVPFSRWLFIISFSSRIFRSRKSVHTQWEKGYMHTFSMPNDFNQEQFSAESCVCVCGGNREKNQQAIYIFLWMILIWDINIVIMTISMAVGLFLLFRLEKLYSWNCKRFVKFMVWLTAFYATKRKVWCETTKILICKNAKKLQSFL